MTIELEIHTHVVPGKRLVRHSSQSEGGSETHQLPFMPHGFRGEFNPTRYFFSNEGQPTEAPHIHIKGGAHSPLTWTAAISGSGSARMPTTTD
jgi:hypothetical protein